MGPIAIHFDKQDSLVQARTIDSEPSGIEAKISIVNDAVQIEPLLLNPREAVLVHVLAKNDAKLTRVSARGPALTIGREKSKYENGLYVATVLDLGSGASTYYPRFQLPVWLLSIATVSLLLLASVSYLLLLAAIDHQPSKKHLFFWLMNSLVLLAVGLGLTLLLRPALVQIGIDRNVAYWAPLVLMLLVFFSVFWFRSLIDTALAPSKQKIATPPKLP